MSQAPQANHARGIVRKVELRYEQGFDSEFWPVVLATCVLAAICLGAVITLLSGIWMWASLLILPGLMGLGLAVLRQINHRTMRRSFQLAIIFSAALHVLFLILSVFWSIFSVGLTEELVQTQSQQKDPIRIRIRQENPTWQPPEPETEMIPEPEPEPVEKQMTETEPERKPTEFETPAERQNPLARASSKTSQTVPRFAKSLSRASRQPSEMVPRPSAASTASAAASPSKSETSASNQPRKVEVTRQQPAPIRVSKSAKSAPAKAQPNRNARRSPSKSKARSSTKVASRSSAMKSQPVVKQPTRSAQKAGNPGASLSRVQARSSEPSSAAMVNRSSTRTEPQVARQSRSMANPMTRPSPTRLTRSERTPTQNQPTPSQRTPRIQRSSTAQRPVPSPPSASQPTQTQTRVTETTPRAQRTEIRRQSTALPRENSRPEKTSQPSTNLVQQTPMEQTPRRQTSPSPSLPRFSQSDPQPRRTLMASPQVQSPANVESPSSAKTNRTTGPSQVSPRALALSKSETGTAGSGSSQNFNRSNGPAVSPARVASNSSQRAESQSRTNTTQSLASRERSTINRSVTGAPTPQQVVRNNSKTGSRSGTPTPQTMNESSSASIQSSSTNDQRSERSADKGSATVDVGPQKIVANQSPRNRGGGGQPQLSRQSSTSQASESGSGPAMRPQVATTQTAPSTSAPLTQGSDPNRNSESQPNAQSSIAQRASQETIQMGRPADRAEPQFAEVDPSSLSGTSQQNRAERTRSSQPSLAASGDTEQSERDPLRNGQSHRPQIANLPSRSSEENRSGNQNGEPTESETESLSGAASISKQSLVGSVNADRAEESEFLIQANNSQDANLANTASRRRTGIGGEQSSRMLVGQSQVDRQQLSPNVGGPVGEDSDSQLTQSGNAGNGESEGSMEPGSNSQIAGRSSSGGMTGSKGSSGTGGAGVQLSENSTGRAQGQTASPQNSPTQRTEIAGLGGQTPRVIQSPGAGLGSLPATGQNLNSQSMEGDAQVANLTKQSLPGTPIEFGKVKGAGGIGDSDDPQVGINSLRASRESQTVQLQPTTRFRRTPESTRPRLSSVPVAKKAFRGRRQKRLAAQSPSAAKSIELGLNFLARQQNEDGSWSLDRLDRNRRQRNQQLSSDTAATGLALLAFQGAGFNHKEYFYAERLANALDWLKQNQKQNGDLYVESNEKSNQSCQLYSHAIATLAVCEAYGMTQDPELRSVAQKAIEFIEKHQHELGGWRYYSQPVSMQRSDTSVTGWMVMALQSARLSGLKVDNQTFKEVERYLGFAVDREAEHKFRYNPEASLNDPMKAKGRQPTHSMTSVGLLMRMYLGWNRDDERLIRGADYLLTRLPSDATIEVRDTYYWYYATQVLNHVGGERWERWNQALEPLLIRTQVQGGAMEGSWDPYSPVPDRWSAFGGRVYLTAMNLLNLEVEYRKLPLYENTAK